MGQFFLLIKIKVMGNNLCCSGGISGKLNGQIVSIRKKSLNDPCTKKEYERSLESILNQALQKFEQKYKINSLKLRGLIGKGGQASVFQVDVLCDQNGHKLTKKLAMKRVSKKNISQEQVKQALLLQKQILTTRTSCFITEIQFACQDDSYLYFFMKLAIGGDCFSFIKDELAIKWDSNLQIDEEIEKVRQFAKLGQKAIIFILAAVVLGLESLHSLNIIYRDLKPQNILIFEDGYPKLADFGVAAKYDDDDDLYFQMKGTILYFAPEMARKRGYDRSVDLWALGVLAYQLTFKEPAFATHYIKSQFYERKVSQRLEDDKWPSENASNQMKSFINKLLVLDPNQRLGYASFNQIKQHQLFSGINWNQFEARKMKSPLINLIKKYPVIIKTEAEIYEMVDQENHGYIPFTFVRNTNDTDRRTLEIIPLSFVIDDHMNLMPSKDSQSSDHIKKVKRKSSFQ